jgi:hypothetical protein
MDILNRTGNRVNHLTLNEIQEKHNTAISKEVVQYKTSLSKLEMVDEDLISLNHNSKNIEMPISHDAYSHILNIGLFNSKMKNTFQKILKDKEKTISFLNKFRKELIHNQGDVPIILIGDKNSQRIVKIIEDKKGFEVISNSDFLKNVYNITNRYNLKISSFSVDHLGQIDINTILDNQDPFIIESLDTKFGLAENESFHRGLYFSSKIGNYRIIPTTLRLLCSNQITLNQLADSISFNNLKMLGKSRLDNQLEKLKEYNFVPKSFRDQVRRAFSTPASLNEFENITNLILDYSNLEKRDLDNYINYSEIKESFDFYEQKNNIVLNKNMKAQIPTDKTVWEMVNTLTYIASNTPTAMISDRQRETLKIKSGEFLRGDSKNGFFDLQLRLNTPFSKRWV